MRKATALFMLAVFLFSNTELHELGKVRAFIGHFREHRAADPEISVLGFIQLHYFNGGVRDEDYDRDMQLPFKAIDCTVSGAVFTLPQHIPWTPQPPVQTGRHVLLPITPQYTPSAHLSTIWQPPKSC